LKLSTGAKQTQNLEWTQERLPTQTFDKVDRKDVASLAQGFLQATNVGTFNFTALLECIYGADQEAMIMDQVVHMLMDAFKTKNW
jgi:aminoglycoside N3'-acetyltransferase